MLLFANYFYLFDVFYLFLLSQRHLSGVMPHASPHLCHAAVMQCTAHMPDGTNGEGPNRRSGLLHVRQTEAMCPQIQHVSLHGVYESRMAETQVSMVSDHVAQKRLLKSGEDRKR